MALIVEGQIELNNGITISSCYGRTSYRVDVDSSTIVVLVDYWNNKQSYLDNKSTIFTSLISGNRYSYNRDTDGTDILLFTQEIMKSELETLGYSVVISDIQ